MKKYIKNITILYLIYSIVFYSNPVFSLNMGGWVKTATSRSGASTTYNGSRSYNPNYAGSSSINSTATLVPLAIDVTALVLRGVGWGTVITVAGLLYQGYQWAEDFQNKRLKGTPIDDGSTSSYYSWFHPEIGECFGISSCNNAINSTQYFNANCETPVNTTMRCNLSYSDALGNHGTYINLGRQLNSQYNPNASAPTPIYVPLDVVSEKIIEMANAGNSEAQALTNAVSDDAWTDNPASPALKAKLQNQLNSNAQHPSDTNASSVTETQASSTNPNASGTTTTNSHSTTSTELPAFCKYASILCDWIGWTKELPDDEDSDNKPPEKELKIDVDIKKPNESLIVFSKSCPAPVDIPIHLFGNTNHLTISYTPLCDFLTMLKPFLIACAYISAGYIILGLSRGK